MHPSKALILLGLFGLPFTVLQATPIVTMQLLNSPGEPDIYDFMVDGSPMQLLCDDALHSIVTTPYQATEQTLSNLSGTLLARSGDTNALLDYEHIAMLDLMALADPTDTALIGNVEEAIWSITQDRQSRDPDAASLLSEVDSENPANFNLSGFVIFATPDSQEQTGFIGFVSPGVSPAASPEPSSWLLAAGGISLLLLGRIRFGFRSRAWHAFRRNVSCGAATST